MRTHEAISAGEKLNMLNEIEPRKEWELWALLQRVLWKPSGCAILDLFALISLHRYRIEDCEHL